jgi:MFS transporter, OFA family, oxalate/formate antiporter
MLTPLKPIPPRTSRLINRTPFFYGWIIVIAGTFGLIMTGPGQTYAVSIFIEHFIHDLGLSRTLVSGLYGAGTLVGSFALPLIGREIDRRGSRPTGVAIALLFGLACIFMGLVVNWPMLLLGFMTIRMLGQGGLGLVSQNVINQWWVSRRGMIMGVSGLGVSLLGIGALPGLINGLVTLYGWRLAYMLLGGVLLLIMAPVAWLFYRDRPELYGRHPDGRQMAIDETELAVAEENWTLAEARRTPMFWIMSGGLALIAMLITGLYFHMVSIFADNGLAANAAAAVFAPIALATAAFTLGGGLLLDRVPARVMLSTSLFLLAFSLWYAQHLSGVAAATLYGAALGGTSGLFHVVGMVVWARYYGRQHLGSITGVTTTVVVIGSALGPLPLGAARDWLGSYNQALTLLAILPLALGAATLFTPRPQK